VKLTSFRPLTVALSAALLSLLLLPALALAAGDKYGESTRLDLPSNSSPHVADVGGGSGGSLARTFVGLAVVVAVIYGVTWVLRQMKASKEERSVGYGLSTEATVPLGPGRSVHLIRAGRELVLVGSAEQGVVPIRTYSEEEALSLGLLAPKQLDSGDDGERPSGTGAVLRATAGNLLENLRQRTAR
jgi:flagellar protein FliO/FliZ